MAIFGRCSLGRYGEHAKGLGMRLGRMLANICGALCVMCVGALNLYGFDTDTTKIIQAYRTHDEKALEQLLEQYLQQKDFWLSVLAARDSDYGYFEGYDYVFVSDKQAPNLSLYRITKEGKLELVRTVHALVGKGKGDKRVSGDLTTPLGVYDFTSKRTGLPAYYGPLAYTTDYPNSYDRSLKKTGYGIWIHGLPLDGNREEINTKGCIAIDNDVLSGFGAMVDYRRALLISYEKDFQKPTKDEIAAILSALYGWRAAWARNDLKTYLSYYSKEFTRPDGMKYQAFANFKKQVFDKAEEKTILFSNISVIPYPNEEGRRMFRISFDQDYKAFKNGKPSYMSKSHKILYISYNQNTLEILSEK